MPALRNARVLAARFSLKHAITIHSPRIRWVEHDDILHHPSILVLKDVAVEYEAPNLRLAREGDNN
jgi:hypothetical protein